jgi:hypothetical protein
MKKVLVILAMILLVAEVQSQIIRSMVAFKRPLPVGAYTAGDVVGDSAGTLRPNYIEFKNVVDYAGRDGMVVSAVLTMDSINVANGTFRLWIFNDTTLTDTTGIPLIADHGALTLLTAYRTKIAGYIDFTIVTAGAGSTMAIAQNNAANIYFQAGKSKSIFGILTATGAYVPARNGNVFVSLRLKQGPF